MIGEMLKYLGWNKMFQTMLSNVDILQLNSFFITHHILFNIFCLAYIICCIELIKL